MLPGDSSVVRITEAAELGYGALKEEVRLRRPNVVTVFLWITGIAILVMTSYVVVTWQGPVTMRDHLLLVLAGSSSVTQIAVGALIDMHTMRHRQRRKTHE